MARKIERLHRLTDYDLGTTVNVGLVAGGRSVNTVAARATAAIDVCFPTLNIMENILGEVREICNCCEFPGSESRILREGKFLPLEQDDASRALLEVYARAAARLGFAVAGEATGGSADSGFTAALGHAHPVRHGAGRRQRPYRRRVVPDRHADAARPGAGADRSCRWRSVARTTLGRPPAKRGRSGGQSAGGSGGLRLRLTGPTTVTRRQRVFPAGRPAPSRRPGRRRPVRGPRGPTAPCGRARARRA
jgi:hypothetical protein